MYFVYLPRNASQRTDYDKKHYNLLKNLIRKLKIEFIDIDKEVFDKEQNLSILYALEGGHYSVEGYKRVAEIIYKFTKD